MKPTSLHSKTRSTRYHRRRHTKAVACLYSKCLSCDLAGGHLPRDSICRNQFPADSARGRTTKHIRSARMVEIQARVGNATPQSSLDLVCCYFLLLIRNGFKWPGCVSRPGYSASVVLMPHWHSCSMVQLNQHGWLTASRLLDGIALSIATPGPFMLFTSFVGFVAGGRARSSNRDLLRLSAVLRLYCRRRITTYPAGISAPPD